MTDEPTRRIPLHKLPEAERRALRERIYEITPELTERFWQYTDPTPQGEHGCWHWTGARVTRGYGTLSIKLDGKTYAASVPRIALVMSGGDVDTPVVRHLVCDNPACVRPDHLRGGTQADNAQDAVRHGRISWQKGRAAQIASAHARAEHRLQRGAKICCICHRDLPLEDFAQVRQHADGRRSRCNRCFSAIRRYRVAGHRGGLPDSCFPAVVQAVRPDLPADPALADDPRRNDVVIIEQVRSVGAR